MSVLPDPSPQDSLAEDDDYFNYPVPVVPVSRRGSMTASAVENDIEDLPESEVRARLRDAVLAIREKDKSLHIAAEIGQQLLQTNRNLSADYEDLLRKVSLLVPVVLSISRPSSSAEKSVRAAQNVLNDADLSTWIAGFSGSPPQQPLRSIQFVEHDDNELDSANVSEEEDNSERTKNRNTSDDPNKRNSSNMWDKIANLERTNADLRDQLEATLENLRESEQRNSKVNVSLRRANAKLQDQLLAALSDLRDAEQFHGRAVGALEADLEVLRHELTSTSQAAAELDAERRRLIREKRDKEKDSRSVESSELEMQKLRERVWALESENARLVSGKREAERKRDIARAENEELVLRVQQLERDNSEHDDLSRMCEEQRELIAEMREQMEETVHLYDAAVNELAFRGLPIPSSNAPFRAVKTLVHPHEMDMVVRNQELVDGLTGEWKLERWAQRSGKKIWDLDLGGLYQEIEDLQRHRQDAYRRLGRTVDGLLTAVVEQLPPGLIKGVTSKILEPVRYGVNIVSGTRSASLSPTRNRQVLAAGPKVALIEGGGYLPSSTFSFSVWPRGRSVDAARSF